MDTWVVNTANPGKMAEFERYFARLAGARVQALRRDLREPDADEVTIMRYKASQFDGVIVDDTSLEVEGARVGTNVKWLVPELERFEGHKATFVCLVGLRRGGKVELYRGETRGTLTRKRGESFGFLPYFIPEGRFKTFAEEWPDELNPRLHAVRDLLEGRPWQVCEPLEQWDGAWQEG